MNPSIDTLINNCHWGAAKFLIFSSNVFGDLVYYSHFFVLFLSLAIGFFILLKNKNSLINRLMFLIMVAFSVWVFFDLILWANGEPQIIMFSRSIMLPIEPLIFALCVYLVDVFIEGKDITFKKKVSIFGLLLPILALLPTRFAMPSFNLTNCLREPIEGRGILLYIYLIEAVYIFWILFFAVRKYKSVTQEVRRQISVITIGTVVFLFSFIFGNFIGNYTDSRTLAQIGLFGMPIFVVFLTYMMVKFKTFDIKVVSAEVLVFFLGFMTFGILFIRKMEHVRIVVALTLLFVFFVGRLLLRSVRKEVVESETLEKSTQILYQHSLELAVTNKTLSLLEKLYQASILTLSPQEIAEKITSTIRGDLNLEFSGLLLFNKEEDSLTPLAFAKSDRLLQTLDQLSFRFKDIKINNVSGNQFFEEAVYKRSANITNDLEEVWKNLIRPEFLDKIKTESHLKTTLLYPLISGEDVIGVLLLGMNRDYESLNTFEKSSIKSLINVVTLSLEKAYLYKNLQDVNDNLKKLIKQRESLVHLITHKVKGSFTHSKIIFANILDGSFGEVSEQIKKMAGYGLESDNVGIETVDLVLNADNLNSGNVKYDMKPVDFKDMVLKSFSDKKMAAEGKGLKMELEIKDGVYQALGDSVWLKEVVNNLIENSIRYSTKGTITVKLEDGDQKIKLSVKDEGLGISDEDKKNLFTEGGRGKDSVRINVDSTGYGLYSVKLIVEAHHGKVWAESEVGKGSTFYVELPSA